MVDEKATRDIEEFAEALVQMRVAYRHQLRGWSDPEVGRVADLAKGFSTPAHFSAFLRRLGRGAGRLLVGTDFYYPVVLSVNEWAREFATYEDPTLKLSGRFFFAAHQGYQYYFFEKSSPLVFMHTEGEPKPQVIGDSFLEFLWREARVAASAADAVRRASQGVRWRASGAGPEAETGSTGP